MQQATRAVRAHAGQQGSAGVFAGLTRHGVKQHIYRRTMTIHRWGIAEPDPVAVVLTDNLHMTIARRNQGGSWPHRFAILRFTHRNLAQ